MGKLNCGNWMIRACGIFLLWATTAVALPAQTFTTLYNFCSQGGNTCTDGYSPNGGLVQGTDGNLYGTTLTGGLNNGQDGFGTVFKITPTGTLTTLHDFNLTDGEWPSVALVEGTDGNFYGTTIYGGANTPYGTVFQITPTGTLTTLHSFDGTDGWGPSGGLIQGSDGNFYGTTAGTATNGVGEVFKITPTGTLTVLHMFCLQTGCPDGAQPRAGLIQAPDGNFYGTTLGGGPYGGYGGTVFKITSTGTLTTLYSFCPQYPCPDGDQPAGGLVRGTDGNFYGTTTGGGVQLDGTVFKITPSGTLTTLHSFDGTDGQDPVASLVKGNDGNFYGTTDFGGPRGRGTVFQITPSGNLTMLHGFDKTTDGQYVVAPLIQDTNGTFYGTVSAGAARNAGTVFSVSVGLGAFVETEPTFGTVGAAVNILGTDLTGTTTVTFHGIAAAFTVVSSSLITATVPTGATSGPVKVLTPGRTLSSNVNFQVQP